MGMRKRQCVCGLAKCANWQFMLTCVALAACSGGGDGLDADPARLAQSVRVSAEHVYAQHEAVTANGTLTYVKLRTSDGRVKGAVRDAQGRDVVEPGPSVVARIDDSLASELLRCEKGTPVSVAISLDDEVPEEHDTGKPDEFGEVDLTTGIVKLNGVIVSGADIASARERRIARVEKAQAAKRTRRRAVLMTMARRVGWQISPAELETFAEQQGPLLTALAAGRVHAFTLENADIVRAVGLHQPGTDDTLATAMADTRVDPGALQLPTSTGSGIGIYMTETGCPPAGHITNYTRISGSDTDHSKSVSAILRATSPNAYVYCKGGGALPTVAELAGQNGGARIHIMNRSNSSNMDATYGSVDRDWDNFVYTNLVLSVNSASNQNAGNSNVGAPGKGLNMLTVGDYADATDTISASSCYVNPTNTKNDKPELSAPGQSINAGGFTMSGTSQATPHVAGIAADFMSSYDWLRLRPALGKAFLIGSACDAITGGFDKVGWGGIDYVCGHYNGNAWWYEGANGAFATWDSQDYLPNNGALDIKFNVSTPTITRVRVAVAWLNRGTYTYDHRSDSHPIPTDIDVWVWTPSGTYAAEGITWDNGFEVADFDPSVTGDYRIEIRRAYNRDTSSKLHLGVFVDRQW